MPMHIIVSLRCLKSKLAVACRERFQNPASRSKLGQRVVHFYPRRQAEAPHNPRTREQGKHIQELCKVLLNSRSAAQESKILPTDLLNQANNSSS